MPGESTRRTPRLTLLDGGLGFEIQQRGPVLRVTLSGVLDRDLLERLRRRTAPHLVRRDRRIVLDGRSLLHIDYRAASGLIAWHRELGAYGHRLWLADWSPYLKTILALGEGAEGAPSAAAVPNHASAS